jgi:hypothetical protein
MVLLAMTGRNREDDEVKERADAGRVLAVISAGTGCDG